MANDLSQGRNSFTGQQQSQEKQGTGYGGSKLSASKSNRASGKGSRVPNPVSPSKQSGNEDAATHAARMLGLTEPRPNRTSTFNGVGFATLDINDLVNESVHHLPPGPVNLNCNAGSTVGFNMSMGMSSSAPVNLNTSGYQAQPHQQYGAIGRMTIYDSASVNGGNLLHFSGVGAGAGGGTRAYPNGNAHSKTNSYPIPAQGKGEFGYPSQNVAVNGTLSTYGYSVYHSMKGAQLQ